MSTPNSSFYSRIFPGAWAGYPKKALTKLAAWLEDTPAHRGDRPKATPKSIPSGYVYFAQFVNHDLSRDLTKLSDAGEVPPEETPNVRTPCLDLEILYDACKTDDGVIFDPEHPGPEGYLKLGTTTMQGIAPTVSDNDLYRDEKGIAQIYEDRNDTTVLLAQLHVLFIKFHNRLMNDIADGKVAEASDGDVFDTARRLVIWHYQWIVRNDLLPKIVMPDILEDILMHWPRLYRPKTGQASIPVEFSLGAFQYGHSAVQTAYDINRYIILAMQEETMYMTGPGHFVRPDKPDRPTNRLPQMFVVDHGRMFGWAPPAKVNFSADIDTLISSGLYKLPQAFSLIVNNQPLEETDLTTVKIHGSKAFPLPESTLRRGAAVGLPSGQEACKLAGVPTLGADQLAYDHKLEEFLRKHGMLDRTPLFYYLLREAEVSGRITPGGYTGKRLGPLGSRIVAEVLLGVLEADPESYVHQNWQPPKIRGVLPDCDVRLDTLSKMMFYAKDYISPRERR